MSKNIIRVTTDNEGKTFVVIQGSVREVLDALGHLFDALFEIRPEVARIFLDGVNDWRKENDQVQV